MSRSLHSNSACGISVKRSKLDRAKRIAVRLLPSAQQGSRRVGSSLFRVYRCADCTESGEEDCRPVQEAGGSYREAPFFSCR
jgi:hypothetical protein